MVERRLVPLRAAVLRPLLLRAAVLARRSRLLDLYGIHVMDIAIVFALLAIGLGLDPSVSPHVADLRDRTS